MLNEQFLLFPEPLEGKLLREVAEVKESLNKVRKGQFAKIGQLRKDYDQLKEDLEIIKRGICQGKPVMHECEVIEMAN